MLASAASPRGSNTSSRTDEDESEEEEAEESESVEPGKRSKYQSLALIYLGILTLLVLAAVFLRKDNRINQYKL